MNDDCTGFAETANPTESGWQPVRIAPVDISGICADGGEQRENLQKFAGGRLIVRVSSKKCLVCGGRLLESSLESARALVGPENFNNYHYFICESQVLAD